MATSIGTFGTPRGEVDLDFDYFGERIRVHPDASDLSIADLMLELGDVSVDSPEGQALAMQGTARFMVEQIHPEDRQRFWELAKANRQGYRDVLEVAKAITNAVADFRSGQPSDSSATPLPNLRSVPASSSADGRAEEVIKRAREALPNRPDLRIGLYRQAAARKAAAQPVGPLGLPATG